MVKEILIVLKSIKGKMELKMGKYYKKKEKQTQFFCFQSLGEGRDCIPFVFDAIGDCAGINLRIVHDRRFYSFSSISVVDVCLQF